MPGIPPIEARRVVVDAANAVQHRDDKEAESHPAVSPLAGLYRVTPNPRPELAQPARSPIRLATPTAGRRERPPKPYADGTAWTPERARAVCQAFSDDAAARGVDTLLIAFEGLVSYDRKGTAETYAWAAGARRDPPRAPLASGYMLHGLVRPLLERHGDRLEFLVLPHEAETGGPDGLPATCARIWQEHSATRRLVVAGHSMGGASASSLARTLAASNTRLDLMVTVDAVATPWTPLQRWPSTAEVYNFPRLVRLPGFGTIANADLETRVPDWHTGVPGHPVVVDAVSRAIDTLIAATPAGAGR